MEDFTKRVMDGNCIVPPTVCLEAFNQHFTRAQEAEWYENSNFYEAIFFQDNIEYIAEFNKNGSFLKYKMYLPDNLLPAIIKSQLETKGEIMNTVLINKGDGIIYEVIYRDKQLNRYLILLNNLGKVLSENLL